VDRITSGGEESVFEYSPAGRLEHRSAGVLPELNVEYNFAAKPTRIWETDRDVGATYRYNTDGVRVASSAPGEDVLYLGELYTRITRPGEPVQERFTISNGARVIAEISRLDGERASDIVQYHHQDQLGSSSLITDEQGANIEPRNFDAFGGGLPRGATVSDFGYTGHRHLSQHGLIDMRGRTYDPAVGQFVSPDPITDVLGGVQGLNPYAYVLNNPFRYVDPSGFQPCDNLSPGCGAGGVSGADQSGLAEGAPGAGGWFDPAYAPGFSTTSKDSLSANASGPEASLGEKILYGGAGVGVTAGTGWAVARGAALVCAASGFCTPVAGTILLVGGTAYFVYDTFFDGGANRVINAFVHMRTKEDAFIATSAAAGALQGIGTGLSRRLLTPDAGGTSWLRVPWKKTGEVFDATVLQQSTGQTCGQACAAMLLRSQGIQVSEQDMIIALGHEGITTADDLVSLLNRFSSGWTRQATSYVKPPFAAMMWPSRKVGHWVVVRPGPARGFFVADPASGTTYMMTRDDFVDYFSGHAVYLP
jgi:RHS repeat-associated protein